MADAPEAVDSPFFLGQIIAMTALVFHGAPLRLSAIPVLVIVGLTVGGITPARAAAYDDCVPPPVESEADEDEMWDLMWDELPSAEKMRAEFEKTLKACDAALAGGGLSAQRRAEAYYHRGQAHLNLKDIDRAIADYSAAIELLPEWISPRFSRANEYGKKNMHQQAIADYSRVIELDPRNWLAHNYRARQYEDIGDLDAAIAGMTKAIEVDGEPGGVQHSIRAMLFEKAGNIDSAIADLTSAANYDDDEAEYPFRRGKLRENKGEHGKAIADYRRTLKIDPDHTGAQARLKALDATP